MIRSIRGRLSLSHALVALFTTLLLGGLVLVSLATYYSYREERYLNENATALSNLMGALIIEETDLDLITAQINTFSFLTQTRVRLLDLDGQPLADSGSPAGQSGVATINLTLENDTFMQSFSRQFSEEEEEVFLTEVVIDDGTQSIRTTTSIFGSGASDFNEPLATPFSFFSSGLGPSNEPVTLFRSTEIIVTPIRSLRGETIGFVELSEGPAYGRPVLLSVFSASLAAGLVTFFLAGGLGRWLSGRFSRPLVHLADTARAVRQGDLSARANLDRQDEIGLLADSFDQMADRLEENMATLRRFVFDASHEFRTPLTALRSYLELMQEEDEQPKYVAAGLRSVQRLDRLVEDLLHLAQSEVQTKIELVPLELNDAVRQWCEPAAAAAEQKEIDFVITLGPESVWVAGHALYLERVITNLLENAVKFTPSGGQIHVAVKQIEQQVQVKINDTGIGLGEDPEQLFERFARAPQALEYPGSGLGLAVVRELVKQHGGTVAGQNAASGAQFVVTLPSIDNP